MESNPLIELGSDLAIAIYGNLLIRYAVRKAEAEGILMLVLPVLVAISCFHPRSNFWCPAKRVSYGRRRKRPLPDVHYPTRIEPLWWTAKLP